MRSTALLATFSWLILVLVDSSSCCFVTYARLGDSEAQDSVECGMNSSLPCRTISQALINSATQNEECTEVRLQPSAYDDAIACEDLDNLENVVIDGSNAGRIPLSLVTCAQQTVRLAAGKCWLQLFNASRVTLQMLDVDLNRYAGHCGVLMQFASNVTFWRSRFGYPSINTSSIIALESTALMVAECEFYGEHAVDPFFSDHFYLLPKYQLASIIFNQSCRHDSICIGETNDTESTGFCCDLPTGSRIPAVSAENGFDILVQSTTFRTIGIIPGYSRFSKGGRSQDATALHMHIGLSENFQAYVENCTFSNMSSPYDTVLKLYTGHHARNVQFTVSNSAFENGFSNIGGGLRMRVSPGSFNTTLRVINSTFINNTAFLDGGAISISYGLSHSLSVTNDTSNYFATISGCHFLGNRAGDLSLEATGGAMSIISPAVYAEVKNYTQALPTFTIVNSTFIDNSAPYAAGIFASGIQLSVMDTLFQDQKDDSAIAISNSHLTLQNNVTFLNNSAASKGGAISLRQFSVLSIQDNARLFFINNTAGYRGGAIYADEPSSTVDIADLQEYNSNGFTKPCFIQSEHGVSYAFNSTGGANSTVHFSGNRASIANSIFANSYTSCLIDDSPLLSNMDATIKATQLDSNVPVASGSVWLLFKSAGCDCFKTNPRNTTSFWLYHRYCSRSQIYSDILNSSTFQSTSYPQELNNFAEETRKYFNVAVNISGFHTFAPTSYLAVPWAVSTYQWFYPRNNDMSHDDAAIGMSQDILASTYVSQVVLYPASGEMFPLEVEMADISLEIVVNLLFMQVVSGDVLLIHNGRILGFGEETTTIPSSPIMIGLAGRPGEEGKLRLSTSGQLEGNRLELIIPFRIKVCHTGYLETKLMTESQEVIRHYVRTFRTAHLTSDREAYASKLLCQCPDAPGVVQCVNGSDITMEWDYWAGETGSEDSLNTTGPLEYLLSIEDHEAHSRSKKFLTNICYAGFCTDHNRSNWNIRQQGPCTESRKGLICGTCADGFGIVVAWNPQCRRCTPSDVLNGQLVFLWIVLQTGLELFLLSYFKVGTSAIFDSWVNFEQFCLFLVRREISFWTVSTLNYAHCLGQDATILEMTAATYSVTFIFALWVFVVFQLSRVLVVKRFIMNHSLVVGIWAVFIFSFSFLLLPSFSLLACHQFNGHSVLFHNAAITCFGSEHWPWGLLAICVVVFVIIPSPLVLLMNKSSPRLKPIVDVYLSYVKDDKHWFIAFSMARRIIVAVLSVYIVDSNARQITLAFVMQCYLVLHFVIQPYRERRDNIWEAVFLGFACFFALLNVLPLNHRDVELSLLRTVYLTPVCAALASSIYRNRVKVLKLLEYLLTVILLPCLCIQSRTKDKPLQRFSFRTRKGRPLEFSESYRPLQDMARSGHQSKADLRDSLLADAFPAGSASSP